MEITKFKYTLAIIVFDSVFKNLCISGRSHLRSLTQLQNVAAAKSLQLCLILCDPIGSSPPGSSVSGILKARTLEWVAISFSSA